MKRTPITSVLAALLLTAVPLHLRAQSLFWNNGTGTWDTTTANWATSPATTPQVWVNGYNATINAPAGTVTIQPAGVSVLNMTMGSGSTNATWTLTGGSIALVGPTSTWATSGGSAAVHVVESVITGSSSLTKTGTRILILAADNTFTGDLINGATGTGVGSTLQIGNGGTTGSVTGNIVAGNRLTFNRSDTYTYAGVISGTSAQAVTQAGSGTLILTGANTYTNPTSVSAGTLQVDGSLASSAVTVTSGGTLAGSGTIAGNVSINSGAFFRPGSSPGVISIGGNLTLGGTAETILEIDGLTRGTEHDGFNVGGIFTANGALTLDFGADPGTSTFLLGSYGSLAAVELVPTNFTSVAVTGVFSGTLSDMGEGLWSGMIGAHSFDLLLSSTEMTLAITAAPIPEPSTYAALAGLVALAGVVVQRRRRRAAASA